PCREQVTQKSLKVSNGTSHGGRLDQRVYPHTIWSDLLLTITEVRLADGEPPLYVGEITHRGEPKHKITPAHSYDWGKAEADLVSQFEKWVDEYVVRDQSPPPDTDL